MRKVGIIWALALSVWLAGFSIQGTSAQSLKLPVYSYYDAPPFHFSAEKSGLVREVVELLDEKCAQLSFDFTLVSRPRLNAMLEDHKSPFVVPLVNPMWFQDEAQQTYLWTTPVFKDHNALISHQDDPQEFHGRATFAAQTVGAPKGHMIHVLDELVAKHQAQRIDIANIPALLKLVEMQKVRMAVVPYALARHHTNQEGLDQAIYFSKRPHQTFQRHLMLVNATDEMRDALDKAIRDIYLDGSLRRVLKKYGY